MKPSAFKIALEFRDSGDGGAMLNYAAGLGFRVSG